MVQKEKQMDQAMGGQQMDPLQEKALDIIQGKIPPPNETIAYIVSRAKGVRNQSRQLNEQIGILEAQLEQARTKALQARGAGISYAEDIRNLLEQPEILGPTKRDEKRIVTP